jgi:peptidyl-prolyl cis-trans isomerase B (cyclophilin B)
VSLVSCDATVEDEPSAEDQGADAIGDNSGKLATLSGKTPIEAYRAAEAFIASIDNYEIKMTYNSHMEYNGSVVDGLSESNFKVNKDQLYYSYAENGKIVREQWYTDNFFFKNTVNVKEKFEMTFAEYKSNNGMPTDDGMLIELEDSAFEGVLFEKTDDGYALAFEISVEDYKKYSGVALQKPAGYTVYFDADANMTRMFMSTTQLVYGMFTVSGDMNIYVENVGGVGTISAPDDADSYRRCPSNDELDKSQISDLSGVEVSDEATDYVMIDVKDRGSIVIRLYPEVAPKTVANFKTLVTEKFYDGLIFHRVIENFMIQSGCPKGDGTGGAKGTIIGEFLQNGVTNNLLHTRGVVSMARSNEPDSASSQFFIVHKDSAHLNGAYAAFGYVVYGMDVVDAIATTETENDKPLVDVVINTIKFVKVSK